MGTVTWSTKFDTGKSLTLLHGSGGEPRHELRQKLDQAERGLIHDLMKLRGEFVRRGRGGFLRENWFEHRQRRKQVLPIDVGDDVQRRFRLTLERAKKEFLDSRAHR